MKWLIGSSLDSPGFHPFRRIRQQEPWSTSDPGIPSKAGAIPIHLHQDGVDPILPVEGFLKYPDPEMQWQPSLCVGGKSPWFAALDAQAILYKHVIPANLNIVKYRSPNNCESG